MVQRKRGEMASVMNVLGENGVIAFTSVSRCFVNSVSMYFCHVHQRKLCKELDQAKRNGKELKNLIGFFW